MLIAAAIHMGFRYKTHVDNLGYDTLNASFNMSKGSSTISILKSDPIQGSRTIESGDNS
jgi:hypothetical protein